MWFNTFSFYANLNTINQDCYFIDYVNQTVSHVLAIVADQNSVQNQFKPNRTTNLTGF